MVHNSLHSCPTFLERQKTGLVVQQMDVYKELAAHGLSPVKGPWLMATFLHTYLLHSCMRTTGKTPSLPGDGMDEMVDDAWTRRCRVLPPSSPVKKSL